MIKKVINFFKEEEGAGLAEYALLLLLIALVCIGLLTTLGGTISGVFQKIVTALA
jgi:pilus assembly protein Flp/PilA